jgi:hypothetical protein
MGMASHLGPWLLGTVKNTTGTTAGLIRNMGATHSYQNKLVTPADTTAQTTLAVLPAGALIQAIQILVTSAYSTTTPTFAFFVNGTAINTAALAGITFGNTGRAGFTLGTNSAAAAALLANVGSTDAIVSFTQTTATASATTTAYLEISYIVRNSDGTYTPTSSQA